MRKLELNVLSRHGSATYLGRTLRESSPIVLEVKEETSLIFLLNNIIRSLRFRPINKKTASTLTVSDADWERTKRSIRNSISFALHNKPVRDINVKASNRFFTWSFKVSDQHVVPLIENGNNVV